MEEVKPENNAVVYTHEKNGSNLYVKVGDKYYERQKIDEKFKLKLSFSVRGFIKKGNFTVAKEFHFDCPESNSDYLDKLLVAAEKALRETPAKESAAPKKAEPKKTESFSIIAEPKEKLDKPADIIKHWKAINNSVTELHYTFTENKGEPTTYYLENEFNGYRINIFTNGTLELDTKAKKDKPTDADINSAVRAMLRTAYFLGIEHNFSCNVDASEHEKAVFESAFDDEAKILFARDENFEPTLNSKTATPEKPRAPGTSRVGAGGKVDSAARRSYHLFLKTHKPQLDAVLNPLGFVVDSENHTLVKGTHKIFVHDNGNTESDLFPPNDPNVVQKLFESHCAVIDLHLLFAQETGHSFPTPLNLYMIKNGLTADELKTIPALDAQIINLLSIELEQSKYKINRDNILYEGQPIPRPGEKAAATPTAPTKENLDPAKPESEPAGPDDKGTLDNKPFKLYAKPTAKVSSPLRDRPPEVDYPLRNKINQALKDLGYELILTLESHYLENNKNGYKIHLAINGYMELYTQDVNPSDENIDSAIRAMLRTAHILDIDHTYSGNLGNTQKTKAIATLQEEKTALQSKPRPKKEPQPAASEKQDPSSPLLSAKKIPVAEFNAANNSLIEWVYKCKNAGQKAEINPDSWMTGPDAFSIVLYLLPDENKERIRIDGIGLYPVSNLAHPVASWFGPVVRPAHLVLSRSNIHFITMSLDENNNLSYTDPMTGNKAAMEAELKQKFPGAASYNVSYLGEQKDGWSCCYRAIREVLKKEGRMDNPLVKAIVEAQTSEQIRDAVLATFSAITGHTVTARSSQPGSTLRPGSK